MLPKFHPLSAKRFIKDTSKNHFLDAVAHDGSPETIVFRPIGSKRLVRVLEVPDINSSKDELIQWLKSR